MHHSQEGEEEEEEEHTLPLFITSASLVLIPSPRTFLTALGILNCSSQRIGWSLELRGGRSDRVSDKTDDLQEQSGRVDSATHTLTKRSPEAKRGANENPRVWMVAVRQSNKLYSPSRHPSRLTKQEEREMDRVFLPLSLSTLFSTSTSHSTRSHSPHTIN